MFDLRHPVLMEIRTRIMKITIKLWVLFYIESFLFQIDKRFCSSKRFLIFRGVAVISFLKTDFI